MSVVQEPIVVSAHPCGHVITQLYSRSLEKAFEMEDILPLVDADFILREQSVSAEDSDPCANKCSARRISTHVQCSVKELRVGSEGREKGKCGS